MRQEVHVVDLKGNTAAVRYSHLSSAVFIG